MQQNVDFFYRYAARKYGRQTLYLFNDMNELYSMVNKVFSECIKRDPDCANQFIINKINWTFIDMYQKACIEKKLIVSLDNIHWTHQCEEWGEGNQAFTSTVGNWPDFSDYEKAEIAYAISLLNADEKKMIQKYYFDEKTLLEIAVENNIGKVTVLRNLRKIYKKLKKILS